MGTIRTYDTSTPHAGGRRRVARILPPVLGALCSLLLGVAAAHAQGPDPPGAMPDTGSGEVGALNTDCAGHTDPADEGSCQEKGGGNVLDIDPYRGPAPLTNPPRDDCDEGGGNNLAARQGTGGSFADSLVDNDMGGGNNRCGPTQQVVPPTAAAPPQAGGQPGGGPAAAGEVLAQQQAAPPQGPGAEVKGEQEAAPAVPGEEAAPGAEAVPGAPAGPGEEVTIAAPAAREELPFTGPPTLWLVLAAALLGGGALALRRLIAERG